MMKVSDLFVSLLASFDWAMSHAGEEASTAVQKDVDSVKTRPNESKYSTNEVTPVTTTSSGPTFIQNSASVIGRRWEILTASANA